MEAPQKQSSSTAVRQSSPAPSSDGSHVSRRLSWTRTADVDADLVLNYSSQSSLGHLSHPLETYDAGTSTPFTHVHRPYRYATAAASDSSIDDARMAEIDLSNPDMDFEGSTDDLRRLTSRPHGGYDEEVSRATPRASRQREYGQDGQIRPATSPLRFAGNFASSPTVKAVSSSFRRASMRVVNIIGESRDGRERLSDGKQEDEVELEDVSFRQTASPVESSPTHKLPPLVGKALGYFEPDSRVRRAMFKLLRFRYTEQIILALIILNVVVLSIQAARPLNTPRPSNGYFQAWEDYVLFVLFIIFTLEMFARILVSGLILDPRISLPEIDVADPTLRHIPTGFVEKAKATFNRWSHALVQQPTTSSQPAVSGLEPDHPLGHTGSKFASQAWRGQHQDSTDPTLPRRPATSNTFLNEAPFQFALKKQHSLASQGRPFLRHSWHRVDLVAVVAFWITFWLAVARLEVQDDRHIFIFRALSILRAGRLLVLTSGTMTILHSLKTAGPLLIRVSAFVIFALVLFSVIGVQAFRGSFRRVCMYTDPNNSTNIFSTGQICGGYIHPEDLSVVSFVNMKGVMASLDAKGYICPLNQQCVLSGSNPHDNSQSFDHVFAAAMQVIIIASVNTWAPIMYLALDAEYFSSSLYFIAGVIVLNFWLINLFVAVVINTFKSIRADTRHSAFGGGPVAKLAEVPLEDWQAPKRSRWPARLKTVHRRTRFVWVALVLADIVFQATKTANTSQQMLNIMSRVETAFTIAFDFEIVVRFLAAFPDWRAYFESPANNFDMFLALTTSVIQIPPIHASHVYPWLTVFQLLRWYRVVLMVPRMKPLLDTVFGGYAGLANMVTFLFLVNYIAALFALQIFHGDIPADADNVSFSQQLNAFYGMYQVFSSEDWTTLLYVVIENGYNYKQGIISAALICIWLLFANFIVLQLFIAVINENFHIAEDVKRKQQMEAFVKQSEPISAHVSWIERLNPYRLLKAKPESVSVPIIPANLVLPLQKSVFLEPSSQSQAKITPTQNNSTQLKGAIKRLLRRHESTSAAKTSTSQAALPAFTGDNQILRRLLPAIADTTNEQDDVLRERLNRQADFIAAHPGFDRTLWMFSSKSKLRRACQVCVPPAYGHRINGREANMIATALTKCAVFLTVVASIVVIAITTPTYRKKWVDSNGVENLAWYDKTEVALGGIFIVEFLIKIIADGFIFAPNAYLLSVWNVFDLVILITILVNLSASIIYVGELSRFTRAIKGFRALRLITLFSRLRDTFHVVVVAGALRILDASVLMILYIIPFAVWGLNIFSGLLFACNDGDASGKAECSGIYQVAPVDDSSSFLVPRVWSNPGPARGSSTWAFDSFREAILILFEIVSLEGWIDVLFSVMDITSRDDQPQQNHSQWNGLYLVIYHLFGGVIILTLFVSIIIEAFNTRSGNALLTREQRHWDALSKFIRRQTPSRLPLQRPGTAFRGWCYDRAVNKHGFWARSFTVLYCVHILFLCLVDFENTVFTDSNFDVVFLVLTITYAVDLVVRFYGLGLRSFRANGWNLFDVIVIAGSLATTIPSMQATAAGIPPNQVNGQLQKLFLVSIALKLVQRSSALNQLFKTSIASLPAIGNLFLLWGSIFIFFAILNLEVFGLTKIGQASESRFQNYATLGNSLIMLSFMSVGEGWNGYMHDYTVSAPRCTQGDNFLYSDCGSTSWAFGLFISWNIISMYIFVNMFTGVVVESFAYVYQMPGQASLNREDIRAFKKIWAEFDTQRSGFLTRAKFVPFLRRLTGALELRPYPPSLSVQSLIARSVPQEQNRTTVVRGARHSVDVQALETELATVDADQVRERKRVFAQVFYETELLDDRGKGIGFAPMLRMLAHHKLIDDDRALQLDELLARKAKMERVQDLVNLDRVRSMLLGIYWRRRYLKTRAERYAQETPGRPDIPAIVLQTAQETEAAAWDALNLSEEQASLQVSSLGIDPGLLSNQPPHPNRRSSDSSLLSSGDSDRASVPSASDDDPDILAAMSSSVWGDMLRSTA